MNPRRDILIGLSILLFGLASSVAAAHPEQNDKGEYEIRVHVGLTVLPVTVTDHKDHRVAGLQKSDFKIFEDGRPQDISLFETEDAPVTVGLLVDNSLSMEPVRPSVMAAAVAFAESCNPRDEIFVVNFNQRVSLERPRGAPFTRSPAELKSALSAIRASGRTALYDAIVVALEHLKRGTAGRKYLIIISDGGDNASRHSRSEILNMARNSNAAIYTVGISNEHFSGDDLGVLRKLAKVTGGEFYSPNAVPEVSSTLKLIARNIRQQYTLGYVPTNQAEDGKFRTIRVTATAPGGKKLAVHTRAGYLAPAPAPERASVEGAQR